MKQEFLIITPKTKVFDLLEVYPQLENVLLKMAPVFKKLQNPILRNTITKITNLSQAAVIAGIKVEELVNKLRKEVGQNALALRSDSGINYTLQRPPWINDNSIVNCIDIRVLLHAGEQPVHEVLSQISQLKENEILEVIAPFIPAPLIDKTLSMGYEHWLQEVSNEEFHVYIKK